MGHRHNRSRRLSRVGVNANREIDAGACAPTAAELGTAVDLPIISCVASAAPLNAGHTQQLTSCAARHGGSAALYFRGCDPGRCRSRPHPHQQRRFGKPMPPLRPLSVLDGKEACRLRIAVSWDPLGNGCAGRPVLLHGTCGAMLERSRRLPYPMLRLWLTTLNHQERKYAHWAKNSKAVQKSSAAWATSLTRHLLPRSVLPGRAKRVCDWKARTGVKVVEPTSHSRQPQRNY
jgi:hypothetical protein